MNWGSMPEDVVDVILSSLPLVELARVSTTCASFQAMYRRRLAREHEARCGLAVNYFGHELLTTITGSIIQLFKGEPLDLAFDEHGFWWGVWGNAVTLTMSIEPHWRLPGDLLFVDDRSLIMRGLDVYIPWDRKGVHISVFPGDDDDDEMLALVQAILSHGLAQIIHDAGKGVEILISREWQVPANQDVVTRVGLKAQIGPLMQFASRCISTESMVVGSGVKWVRFTERLQIGEVASAAEEETE